MLKSLILFCVAFELVYCGSDLCQNGAKIDAITYIDIKDMWFFTSGGHYWFTKASDFPPKEAGTPLPGGFKRGDAAIFRNTLTACKDIQSDKQKPQEQEIHLLELVNGENKILIYDTRTNDWTNADSPTPYNKDRGLGQAKIDWTKQIDAAFIYKKTNIVVIQGKRYSVVDISNVCKDPNGWGDGKQSRTTTDLNVLSTIDATAAFNDRYFYLFQDQVFWKVEVTAFRLKGGQMSTTKNLQQDTLTEFWKFEEHCKLPPTVPTEAYIPVSVGEGGSVGDLQTEQIGDETQTDDNPVAPPEEPLGGDDPTPSEASEGGFPWIIVLIIVIIIVVIAIVLIACLAMRKSKGTDAEAAQDVAPGSSKTGSATGIKAGSATGSTTGGKGKSNMGNSPSTMSVRSNAGLAGGKSGAKGGAKDGKSGSKGMSYNMGSSPSTMSVRSNAGLATSKAGSKTGSKK